MDESNESEAWGAPSDRNRGDRKKPSRTALSLVLAVLVLITVGNYVSTAIIATLIKHHPAWLIGLNPTTRNLILVASEMPATLYFSLAIVRRMLPHPLWYLLGRWYGEAGIRWVQRRSPDIGAMVTALEQYFPRFGWLFCILYPAPLVCTMAGASTMGFGAFMFFTIVGVVAFTVTARAGSDLLHPVTSAIANFSARYWIPLTVLSVAIVLIGLVSGQMSGRSKIESINTIENELDAGFQEENGKGRTDGDPHE